MKMKKINTLFIFFIILTSSLISSFAFSDSAEATWQCNAPRNTAAYDYLLTVGYQDRAECIRGRLACPVGWGDNCGVGCEDAAACGDCECRCQGSSLYCADIWRDSDGDLMSQSCRYTAPSSLCIPTASVLSPASYSTTNEGTSVYFNGKGTDPNSEDIVDYKWVIRTSADTASGDLSNDIVKYSKNFSLSTLNPDSYYVFFKARNKQLAWSSWVWIRITVNEVINGSCGSRNAQRDGNYTINETSYPVGSAWCRVGTAGSSNPGWIYPSIGSVVTWLCNGSGGGTNDSCSATRASISCGDGTCSEGEDNNNCPGDCPPECGDGICSVGEDNNNCPGDCPPECGDGICSVGEDNNNCPGDCTSASCGNTACESGENNNNCAVDCPTATCGNTACESGEDTYTCSVDCPSSCPNAVCESGENPTNCLADCPIVCGNGTCDLGEDELSCSDDCSAVCGNGICAVGEEVSCPEDCGPVCGDGVCETGQGENFFNCHADCRIDYREI